MAALNVIPARRALRISHTTDALLPFPDLLHGAVENLQEQQPLPLHHDSDSRISKQALALPKCGFLQFRDAYNLTTANWSLHLVISSLSNLLSAIPSRVSLHACSCPSAPPKRKLPSEIWAEEHNKKASPIDEASFTQMFKDKARREATQPLNEPLFTAPVRKPDTQHECKQQ